VKIGSLVVFTANNGDRYFGIVKKHRQWDLQTKVLWLDVGVCLWTNRKHLEVICEGG